MNAHLLPWQISADDFPADGSAADQLEFLLGYAILAPSPHNTQPWLFRLNAKDVEIFADPRRALHVADPDGRELAIACGAALYNLRTAAEHFGRRYQVKIAPDPGNPYLLVRFQLDLHGADDAEEVLIFNAMTRRRTCRKAFVEQAMAPELLEAWTAAATRHGAWLQVVRDEPERLAVAELVAEADRIQWADKRFRAELANWSRSKPFERGDGFPATALGINEWLSFAGPTLLRTFDRGGGQAAVDREIALHSPVLAVLGTESDDTRSWIDVGQAMENVLLSACAEEFQASFLNQPIEVPELRPRLAECVGRTGFPQVLMRLGHGPEAAPTPRRAVRNLLVPHLNVHD